MYFLLSEGFKVNKLLLELKNIDMNITNLMKRGIKFSFLLMIFASIILLTYDFLFTYPIIYYAGFSLFKTSLFFMVGFIIFGFAFNKIKAEIS